MDSQEPNRHQRRRMRTQEKLKKATFDLLLEEGYDEITIQKITDRADLGRATFYIHFKDKEDIVWELIRAGIDVADQEAHRRLHEEKLPESPALFGYSNMFQVAEKNRDLYRIMLGSHGSASLTARVQDYLALDLREEMKSFPLYPNSKVPLEVQAQIITGAVVRLIIWWLESDNNYNAEEMAEMLYETLHPELSSPTQ
jgi:AcrR family transcriptional regulator